MSSIAAKSRLRRQIKGSRRLEEPRAGLGVARAGARLDHRGALPVLAHAFVIGFRRFGRDGDLGGARVGAQPQIDAEDITVGGDVGDQLDHMLDDVDGGAARIVAFAEGKYCGVVEHDEVDVARIIELEGAVFAHREHDETGGGFQRGAVLRGQRRVARGLLQGKTQRALHRRIGETRQRRGDIFQREDAGDVGQRNGERGAALGLAQGRHDLGFFSRRRPRARAAAASSSNARGPSANRRASTSCSRNAKRQR